jgi:Trk-type K+ transport system membrane component
MNEEIKPVYQVRTVPHGWREIPEEKYKNALDNLEIDGRRMNSIQIYGILIIILVVFCLICFAYLAACAGAGEFINFIDWFLLRDTK